MKQLVQKQYKKSTVIYADGGGMIQKYGGDTAGGDGGGSAWGLSDDDYKTWARNKGFHQPSASSVWKRTRSDGTVENATKMLYRNGNWAKVNNIDKINNADQNTDIINSSVANTSSTSSYTVNPGWNNNDISQFLLFLNGRNNLPELNKTYDLGTYGVNKDRNDGKWGKNPTTQISIKKDDDILKGTGIYGYNQAFEKGGSLINKHKFSKF